MRRGPFNGALLVIALTLMPVLASAHSTKSGDISIGHVWAYPSKTGNPSYAGALDPYIDVYVPLLNSGGPDMVEDVTSVAAKKVELAQPSMGHFIFLKPVIDLPRGQPVALSPAGAFLRLSGLAKTYKNGEKFPITFRFRYAPKATIDVMVENQKLH